MINYYILRPKFVTSHL